MLPSQASENVQVYRFAGWELDLDSHELRIGGQSTKIGRPAFNLLRALAAERGRVVDKDTLIAVAWPRRIVAENNLSVQVAGLRKLLGSDAIANVSGVGYRLAATPLAPQTRPAEPAPADEAPLLLGRDAEVAAVAERIRASRLVSIVGTGGVGKTALAQAVMRHALPAWPDGVHWIDLSPLRSAGSLPPVLARALGISGESLRGPAEDIALALARRRALVVLDNCEHLLADVAALLAPVLQHSGGVHWLATSQEPLRLDGEDVFRLAPLDLPAPGASLQEAMRSGALVLFCDRARQTDRRFALDGQRLAAAIDLCRRLDGLPLALEMAAARVGSLGLAALRDQIDQRLRLRAPSREGPQRHQTLAHTYDWSYSLLDPVQQRVFRRLEPFSGGFTVPMVQALCCAVEAEPAARGAEPFDAWDVAEALASLVDKSLVQRATAAAGGSGDRLQLLESARDYARLQLEAAGETATTRRCHAQLVAETFRTAHTDLEHWADADWDARYGPERRNVAAALGWACGARDPLLVARLVTALGALDRFALFSLPHCETVHFGVDLELLQTAPVTWRAPACSELGWLHFLERDAELGVRLLRGALADFEALQDEVGIYLAKTRLIRVLFWRPGGRDEARRLWEALRETDPSGIPLRSRLTSSVLVARHFEDAQDIDRIQALKRLAERAGYEALAVACRMNVTDELVLRGRFDEAVEVGREALSHGEATHPMKVFIWHNLALALVRLGRLDEAQAAAAQVLRARPGAAHMVMDLLASIETRRGHAENAAVLCGRSRELKRQRQWVAEPAEAALIAETEARLRKQLDPRRLDELAGMAAAMSNADVLAPIWRGS